MKIFRCVGLVVIALLSACDSRETPAPKPKVVVEAPAKAPEVITSPVLDVPAAPKASAPDIVSPATPGATALEPLKPPVYELKPNVPVVPVIATDHSSTASKTPDKAASAPQAGTAKSPVAKAEPAPNGKKTAAAKKGASSKDVVKSAPPLKGKLDLSLPPELVKQAVPAPAPATRTQNSRKPLLPPLFGDKDAASDRSPFELNGRLLTNEMQLQMRNDNRRDVEGAALDFKFKQ